jgi:hypothetical protein
MDQRILIASKAWSIPIDLFCVQTYSVTVSFPNMWRINSKQTAKNIKMCNNSLQNVGTSLQTCISKRLHCSYRQVYTKKVSSCIIPWYYVINYLVYLLVYCRYAKNSTVLYVDNIKCSKYCTIVQEDRYIYNFTLHVCCLYICLCTYTPPPPNYQYITKTFS